MATRLKANPAERVATALWRGLIALAATVLPLIGGAVAALSFGPTLHSQNFPWITARALGIAAYLALFALVTTGTWMRHPWRLRSRASHAETRLRAHAALGIATLALVAGHVLFLVTDRYAGVGWVGALVPGAAHYRAVAVALGVVGLDLMLAIVLTARFAGRRGARHWLAVHRLAGGVFVLSWFHGVLAGSDASALRPLYVATGALLAVLAITRLVTKVGSQPPVDDEQLRAPVRDEHLVEVGP